MNALKLRFQIDDINNNLALRNLESNQGSDYHQLMFEIDETRAILADTHNQSNLNFDQLRLEVVNLDRVLREFQSNFNFELESLRLRVDSMQ